MKKIKRLGLTTSVGLFIAALLVVVFAVLIILSSNAVEERVYSDKTKELKRRVEELTLIVDAEIQNNETQSKLMSANIEILLSVADKNKADASAVLQELALHDPMIESLVIIDRDGNVFAKTTKDQIFLPKDFNYQEQSNFKTIIPEQNTETGKHIITFTNPLLLEKEFIGVLVYNLDFGNYSADTIINREYSNGGYPFIFSSDGIMVAHPQETRIYQDASGDGVVTKVLSEHAEDGFFGYIFKGKNKYSAYKKMNAMPWYVATTIYESDLLSTSVFLQRLISIISIISIIIIFVATASFLRNRVIMRIKKMEYELVESSNGNLTNRLVPKYNDEITSSFKSFNIMLDNFSDFLDNVRGGINNVHKSSSNMNTNISEAASAINEINSNINSVKNQIENQGANTEETAAAVEQLTRNIDALNDSIHEQTASVTQSSAAIEEMTANISSIAQIVVNAQSEIHNMTEAASKGNLRQKEVLSQMEGIVKESDQLMDANEVISNMANQTNLLSMNAAIEAAHAGEAGKGFSVVADEIRKLAEQSAKQSKIVGTNLNTIKSSIETVMQTSKETSEEFTGINTAVNNVNRIFGNIEGAVAELNSGSSQILEGLENMKEISVNVNQGSSEMQSGNQQIIEAIVQLKDISISTKGAVEEINIGMQEINSSVVEIESLSKINVSAVDDILTASKSFTTK